MNSKIKKITSILAVVVIVLSGVLIFSRQKNVSADSGWDSSYDSGSSWGSSSSGSSYSSSSGGSGDASSVGILVAFFVICLFVFYKNY